MDMKDLLASPGLTAVSRFGIRDMKRAAFIALAIIIVLSLMACQDKPETIRDIDLTPTDPISAEPPGEGVTAPPSATAPARTPVVILIGERWTHVLYGRNSETMLLDITSEKEISDFLSATWSEDTNGFIDGWEQIRAALLEESEQAYEFDG